jgi:hypothetical protein
MSSPELGKSDEYVTPETLQKFAKLRESREKAGKDTQKVLLTKWFGDGQLHFVSKDSAAGRWIRFCRWLGLGDEKESFQSASEILSRIPTDFYQKVKIGDKELTKDQANTETQGVRDAVTSLWNKTSPKEKAKAGTVSFAPTKYVQTKQISAFLKHRDDTFKQQTSTSIDAFLKNFLLVDDEGQKNAVHNAIKGLPEKEQESLFKAISSSDIEEPQKCTTLLSVLCERLFDIHSKRKLNDPEIEALLNVITTVGAKVPSDRKALDTKNAPLLFDSLFLRGQGLSENYSWNGFKNYFIDFYKKILTTEQEKSKNPFPSPKLTRTATIVSQLENALDLTTTTLNAEGIRDYVQQQLQTNDKVLLLGGWEKHGTVYEFEKQSDKSVTLRIFDPSQTVKDVKREGYKTVSGLCKTVKNVKFEDAALPNWMCLQTQKTFATLPKDAYKSQQSLIDFAINSLGTVDTTSDYMIALSASSAAAPESSFFSGLLAWVQRSSVDLNAYKNDKFQMKKNLLSDYLSDFQKACQKKISTSEEYDDAMVLKTRIQRSIESFTRWVSKLGPIKRQDSDEVKRLIQDYKASLIQLEKQLYDFDAAQERTTLTSPAIQPKSLEMQAPEYGDEPIPEDDVAPLTTPTVQKLFPSTTDALDKLNGSQSVSNRVEEAVSKIVSPDLPKSERLFAFREICRQVGGSVEKWNNLTFTNPQQAYNNFKAVLTSLDDEINTSLRTGNTPPSDLYFQFFSAQFAMEVAFSQMPENKGLLEKNTILSQTALAQQSVKDKVALLPTSDPVWMAFKDSVANLNGQGSLVNVDPRSQQEKLVEATVAWLRKKPEMYTKFTDDIVRERQEQWEEVQARRKPLLEQKETIVGKTLPQALIDLERANAEVVTAKRDLEKWQFYTNQLDAWNKAFNPNGTLRHSKVDAPNWNPPNTDWPATSIDGIDAFIQDCVEYKKKLEEYQQKQESPQSSSQTTGRTQKLLEEPAPPNKKSNFVWANKTSSSEALKWAAFQQTWMQNKEQFNQFCYYTNDFAILEKAGLKENSQKPQEPQTTNATGVQNAHQICIDKLASQTAAQKKVFELTDRIREIDNIVKYKIPEEVIGKRGWSTGVCEFFPDAIFDSITKSSIDEKSLAIFLLGNSPDQSIRDKIKRLFDKYSEYKKFYNETTNTFLQPQLYEVCYWQTRALELLDQSANVDHSNPKTTFSTYVDSNRHLAISRMVPYLNFSYPKTTAPFHLQEKHDPYHKNIPDTGLRQVYNTMFFEPPVTEQAIPKKQFDIKNDIGQLKEDTVRAVLALKATPGMQVLSTLEYIGNNLSKAGEGGWLNLFHSLLFDDHVLQNEISDPAKRKTLISRCSDLLNAAISDSRASKTYDGLAGVLYLCSSIQKALDGFPIQPALQNEKIFIHAKLQEIIDHIVETGGLEKAGLLFEALALASASCFDKEPIDKDMLGDHLFAVVMMKKFPVGDGHACEPKNIDLENAHSKRKHYLQSCDSQQLSETINGKFKENLNKSFPVLGLGAQQFTFENDTWQIQGKVNISFSTGEATSSIPNAFTNVPPKPLPPKIADLLRVGKFYPKEMNFQAAQCREITNEDGSKLTYYDDTTNGMHFLFKQEKDEETYQTYVQIDDSDVNGWSKHLPIEDDEDQYLSNTALRENFVHVQHPDGNIYLLDPKTYAVSYTYNVSKNKLTVTSKENKALHLQPKELHVVSVEKNPFAEFESTEHTIFLGDDSGLQQVEFPRLNLKLLRAKNAWYLEGQEDWKLAAPQSIPSLRQKGGFLLLENAKTKTQRAIFPMLDPQKLPTAQPMGDEDKVGSWGIPYTYDFPKSAEPIKTAEYEVLPTEGRIVPKDYSARFYLAKIYLERGYTDDAENLMKDILALAPQKKFSSEEQLLLTKLSDNPASGDRGVRVVRLRVLALAMLEANKLQFPVQPTTDLAKKEETAEAKQERQKTEEKLKEEKKEHLTQQRELIFVYLQKTRSVEPIDARQEILLLSSLIPQFKEFGLDVAPFVARAKELEEEQIADSPADKVLPPQTPSVPASSPQISGVKFEVSLQSLEKTVLCDPENDTFLAENVKNPLFSKMKTKMSEDTSGSAQLFPEDSPEVGNDPAKKNQFRKMSADLEEAKKGMQEVTSFLVNEEADVSEKDSLQNAKAQIDNKIPEASMKLQEMGESITEAVAKVLTNTDNPRWTEFASKKRALPTIEELCIHVGCRDYDARMQRLYPELSKNDRDSLKKAIRQYLHQKQFTQRLAYAKDILEKIETADKDFETAQTEFLDNLSITSENAQKIGEFHLTHRKKRINLLSDLKISDEHAKKIEELCEYKLDQEKINKKLQPVSAVAKANLDLHKQLEIQKEALRKKLKMSTKDFDKNFKEIEKLEEKYLTEKTKLLDTMNIEDEDDISTVEDLYENYHNGTRQILLNDLGKALEVKSAYKEEDPLEMTILLMETILKISLREDQINNIKTFAAKALKGEPIALQMIMGAGKTSVLQPMLGYLFTAFSAGTNPRFSSVTLPPALFGKVRDELFKVLGPSFQQLVVVLPYDRFLAKNTDYLKLYLKELKDAKKRGACELRTPSQKESVLTSLQEAFYDLDKATIAETDKTSIKDRIRLISEISTFFSNEEFGQIDEIDLVMNPEKIFTYPVGTTKTVLMERGAAISGILLRLAADDDLNSKVSLDFCEQIRSRRGKQPDPKAEVLNHSSFMKHVRPALIKHAFIEIQKGMGASKFQQVFGSADGKKYLNSFLEKSTEFDEKLRGATSKEASKLKDERKKFLDERDAYLKDKLTPEEQGIIGACSYAIVHLMENAFDRKFGQKYGWERNKETGKIVLGKYIARPYEQSTCQPTEFKDPYQAVTLITMQTLFDKVPEDAAKKMLEELRARVQRGDNDANTEFQRIMENLQGFDLTKANFTEDEVNRFREGVSRDDQSILKFATEFAYKQVKISPESLSCTAHAMVGSAKVSVGYTGTQQVGILPHGMEGVPELGTDGKTVLAVQRKMTDGTSQTELITQDQGKTLADKEIERFQSNKDLFVFIDSGAWLSSQKIPEYYERFLREVHSKRPEIEALVYLNDEKDGEAYIAELRGDTIVHIPLAQSTKQTTSGKVITIMAQRYETGTNIPQKSDAKADLTIRRGMTSRDVLQAVFRMRQITGGQKANMLFSPEVKRDVSDGIVDGLLENNNISQLFVASKLQGNAYTTLNVEELLKNCPSEVKDAFKKAFEALCKNLPQDTSRDSLLKTFKDAFDENLNLDSQAAWRYFNVNQARVEQRKNWLAAQQKMHEIVQKPIRQLLHNTEVSAEDRLEIFRVFKELLVETTDDDPFKQMLGREESIDAETAIKRKVEEFLEKFKKYTGLPVAIREQVLKKFKDIYPPDPKLSETPKTTVEERLRHRLSTVVSPQDIPQSIQVSAVSGDAETQTETEQQTETERVAEQEVVQEQETEIEKVPPQEVPTITDAPEYRSLGDTLSVFFKKDMPQNVKSLSIGISSPASQYLSEGMNNIFFSENLFMKKTPLSNSTNDVVFDKGFRAQYYLSAKYLLVLTEQGKPNRYVLVSDKDAEEIRKKILASPQQNLQPDQKCSLISLDTRKVMATNYTDETMVATALTDDREADAKFAVAKLCVGDTSMGTKEVDALKKMTKNEKGPLEAVRKFYEAILQTRPDAMDRYFLSLVNQMLFRRKQAQQQQ